MISLKEQLAANERVIDRFSPITYQDTQYDCAVTNSRILLYQKDKINGIEIDHQSITSISFEPEWYNDLQFAGIIVLFFGIMAIIFGTLAYFPNLMGWKPDIINWLKISLYFGAVFTPLGVGALYIYFTRIHYHISLLAKEEEFHFYSNEKVLQELVAVTEAITSGELDISEWKIPSLTTEERISGESIATLEGIKVKITFKDEHAKKKSINVPCNINITPTSIQVTGALRARFSRMGKLEQFLGSNAELLITEENLYQIFHIAKEMKVSWVLLLNINFPMENLSSFEYHSRKGILSSEHLLFNINSKYDKIAVEFRNSQVIALSPPQILVELFRVIKNQVITYSDEEKLPEIPEDKVLLKMTEEEVLFEEPISPSPIKMLVKIVIGIDLIWFWLVGTILWVWFPLIIPALLSFFYYMIPAIVGFFLGLYTITEKEEDVENKFGLFFGCVCLIIGAILLWFGLYPLHPPSAGWVNIPRELPGLLILSLGALGVFIS